MPTTGNPALDALLVYGPLGVFLILFITDRIATKGTVERERAPTDAAMTNTAKIADAMDPTDRGGVA